MSDKAKSFAIGPGGEHILHIGDPCKVLYNSNLVEAVFKGGNETMGVVLIKGVPGMKKRKLTRIHPITEGEEPDAEYKVDADRSNAKEISNRYSVDQRFQFMADLTDLVINDRLVSLLITGEGGIGKTYTVMDRFNSMGLVANQDYRIIKGYSTVKGLYCILWKYHDQLLLFDDCDSVLLERDGQNMFKGALDSYDTRIVSWGKDGDVPDLEEFEQMKNAGLAGKGDPPPAFEFTGRIVFISNLKKKQVHQAILSRCATIDIMLTKNEKLARMVSILPNIKPKVDIEIRKRALKLIADNRNKTRDLNFRTLIKTIEILDSGQVVRSPKELAEFLLLS
jgi:hypothetical protein